MDNILSFEEQVKWNRIQDLHIYLKNTHNLDDNHKKLIDVLVRGFTGMINVRNKKQIIDTVLRLLEDTKTMCAVRETEFDP